MNLSIVLTCRYQIHVLSWQCCFIVATWFYCHANEYACNVGQISSRESSLGIDAQKQMHTSSPVTYWQGLSSKIDILHDGLQHNLSDRHVTMLMRKADILVAPTLTLWAHIRYMCIYTRSDFENMYSALIH